MQDVDRLALSALLPEILRLLDNENFVARDLLDHAALDEPLAAALRGVLPCGLNDPTAAKRLGKFLSRVAGFSEGGLTVLRLGEIKAGVLWRVACGSRNPLITANPHKLLLAQPHKRSIVRKESQT